MKSELIGMYSKEYDMTFVVKHDMNDNGEVISNEVTGLYHGEPNEQVTKMYNGQRTVIYDNDCTDPEILKAKAMLQYMEDAIKVWSSEDGDDDRFYSMKTAVTFGDMTLEVDNCAAIYTAIHDCLVSFIDNYRIGGLEHEQY